MHIVVEIKGFVIFRNKLAQEGLCIDYAVQDVDQQRASAVITTTLR